MSMTSEEFKVIISAEISKLKDELEKGKKEVKDFENKSKTSFKDFEENINKAGEVSKKAFSVIAGAITGVVTGLMAMTAATKEYREGQAKLNTAFETAGASADTAKQVYNDLYRILGEDDVAVEAANHLAQITTSQEALSEWTTITTGVFASFGDSLPIESLTEAANETIKVGTVTGALADAINWTKASNDQWKNALSGNTGAMHAFSAAIEGGASKEDAFNEALKQCNSEAEREKLIRETLNSLYSETAGVYEQNASSIIQQNEAQAKLNENMAKIGETLAPVMAQLTELGAELLAKIAPYIEQFINEHGAKIAEMLTAIGEAIGVVISWIADNWEIISTLAVVIGTITLAIQVITAVLTIYNAIQMLTNTTMLAAVAVILLVAAAIAGLIIFWDDISAVCSKAGEVIKNTWSGMGEWFSGIAENIKDGFAPISNWFSDKFSQAKQGVKNAWSDVSAWFTQRKNDIMNVFSPIGTWFSNTFKNAVNGIKSVFSSIPNFFTDIFNKIKTTFSSIGTKITDGLTKGVKSAVNAVLSKAVDVINAVISGINGAIEFINMIPNVNISRIGELSVPKLAKGGVVNSATLAVVGEQGKEAVMPLENNLEWLDKLASMLNDRMGGSQPIVLKVGEKVFGEIACNSINSLTRQTGKLNLVLA